MPRLFLPTARQTNILLTIGFVSLGYALYMRYLVIQQPSVGIACQDGLATWLCFTRSGLIWLFEHWFFGAVALLAALVNLIRPSLTAFAVGLAAAGFGIVLYNVATSGLAVALLILSFARPEGGRG